MFAVLLVPNFRLQATLRFRDELRGAAVALIDAYDPRRGVLEVSEAAAHAGVAPGLTAAQALARCPGLLLLPRSEMQEQTARAALLEVALGLSPEVEDTAGGCCTACLRGVRDPKWEELAERALARLAELRLDARCGVAPNPDLAFLAARQARPALVVQSPATFLANLAVQELDPPAALLSVLGDWGIHTLAQLTSLPRGELADRLGPDAARLWERAAGKCERPLRLVRPVEEFAEAAEFEHEIETTEPLLFLLRRFIEQLTLRLEAAYRVAGRMTLTLPLDDGSTHERAFTVPSPTADVVVLFRIIETHLETLRLEHRPVGMHLRIEPALAERQQFQLFESALRDPNRFGETLGRLAALVGAENVGVPVPGDTHKPDAVAMAAPRFHEAQPDAPGDHAIGLPLRRFRPPPGAEVRVVRHRPSFVISEKVRGVIREALGPYRASGAWWDVAEWSGEEWDVEVAGVGLYRIAREGGEWRVEGIYDEWIKERAAVVVPFPKAEGE